MVIAMCLVVAQAQTSRLALDFPEDTLTWSGDRLPDSLQLPHVFIPENSVRIYSGTFKLLPGIHYTVNGKRGIIYFRQQSAFANKTLKILYKYPPFPLLSPVPESPPVDTLKNRQLLYRARSAASQKRTDFLETFYDETMQLQKSGSLVRGFQIGNNQDLTLNSGLNLQLSGYITPKVKIVAALTDQSTPIQPEGNTATLREVDRVFVRLEAPRIGGTLGDFNLSIGESQFGRVERKLQGMMVQGKLFGATMNGIYGTSRGTYHTNQFLGQEGHQGPYQLRGKNGEREIVVLAGTERVYVDGQLLQRGENNDYIIDYGLGQITFTRNRLITSENIIEVDFEYTSYRQQFSKNFTGVQIRSQNTEAPFFYDVRVFREWDDLNNPLDGAPPLNDDQKLVLKFAGDDRLKATTPGAEFVGVGKGNYSRRDTVLNGKTLTYFKYVGDGQGSYRITFSGVGTGQGDYIRERLGVYRYVGPGNGDYLPVRLLPLPSEQLLANVKSRYQFLKYFRIDGEFALSRRDENVLSPLGDGDNQGEAYDVRLVFDGNAAKRKNTRPKVNWQNVVLQAALKRRTATFRQMDRQFQPLYDYRWNTVTTLNVPQENIREFQLSWKPTASTWLQGEWGENFLGESQASRRQVVEGQFQVGKWPGIGGRQEVILTHTSAVTSKWVRQSGRFWFPWKQLRPEYQFKSEDRWLRADSQKQTGFYYQNHTLSLTLGQFLNTKWEANARLRRDFLYNPHRQGERLKQADTRTYELRGELLKSKRWSGTFSFAFRDKQYDPLFLQMPADSVSQYKPDARFQDTTWQNRQSHLGRVALRYRSGGRWDVSVDYRASSELEALKEKVYVFVGQNRGNYRFDETLQEYVPDPNGDYVLFIVPTNKFQNATLMESAFRLRLRPGRWSVRDSRLKKFWKDLSLNWYARVDEQNRNPDFWRIYFMDWRAFQDENYTIRGQVTVNQDIFYKERNPTWGLVLRSRYRQSLFNQFLDNLNNERRVYWARTLHLRRRFSRGRYTITADVEQVVNKRIVPSSRTRNRDILGNILRLGLVYRPVYRWQFDVKLESGWEKNYHPDNILADRYLDARFRITYSAKSKTRIFFNTQVITVQVTENPFERPVPYEMGKGKKEGVSYNISLRMDYFVNKHVTVTAAYTGRMDAGFLRPIHLGQAEVRAYF